MLDTQNPETLLNHIDGESVAPVDEGFMELHSALDGSVRGRVSLSQAADIDAAVKASAAAQPDWAALKPVARGRILASMARYIRENIDDYAAIEQRETGKPAWQCPIECGIAADYLEMYAGLCTIDHGQVVDLGDGYHAYTRREPFGVIASITPWNSPLSQFARTIATGLCIGNGVVGKPSEFTSGTALKLVKDAEEHCGLPKGLVNIVVGDGPSAGAALVQHPGVGKVAFTGSVRAGREISRMAAERVIPVTMELGGKSPNIIFEDADLEQAIPGALQAFAINAGQVCFAGTRLLVHESMVDVIAGGLAKGVGTVKVGPEPDAMMGAITTRAQYDRVLGVLERAEASGAELVCGGRDAIKEEWGEGWYLPLTIFKNVTNDMEIAREEIFGPVLSIISFKDEDDAIAIANDTDYGLGAGIWTKDLSRAHRVIRKIKAGVVMVNEYSNTDVELPFGGYKMSGHGREKGVEALHHYSQVKTVRIKL